MKFAVELFFDTTTDDVIRREWESISSVSGVRYMQDACAYPHIALSVFESITIPPSRLMDDLSGCIRPLSVTPSRLNVFPGGVLYIGIESKGELVQLQRNVTDILSRYRLDVWSHYTPERWMPHCTLMQTVPSDRVDASLSAVSNDVYQCPWEIRSIGLISFPPTKLIDERV